MKCVAEYQPSNIEKAFYMADYMLVYDLLLANSYYHY